MKISLNFASRDVSVETTTLRAEIWDSRCQNVFMSQFAKPLDVHAHWDHLQNVFERKKFYDSAHFQIFIPTPPRSCELGHRFS